MVTRSREEFFRGLRAFESLEEAATAERALGMLAATSPDLPGNRIRLRPAAHILPRLYVDRPISSDAEWPLIWAYASGLRSWEGSNPTAATGRLADLATCGGGSASPRR